METLIEYSRGPYGNRGLSPITPVAYRLVADLAGDIPRRPVRPRSCPSTAARQYPGSWWQYMTATTKITHRYSAHTAHCLR